MTTRISALFLALLFGYFGCDSNDEGRPAGNSGSSGTGATGGMAGVLDLDGGYIELDSGHFARAVVCHERCKARRTACGRSLTFCESFCTKDTPEILVRCWEQLDCDTMAADPQTQSKALEACMLNAGNECYPIPLADSIYCGENRGLPPAYWFCPIDTSTLPSSDCVVLSNVGTCCPDG